MAAAHVRAVSPNERAPKRKPRPKTLTQAIASGDYLEILMAQRRDIVASLPDEKGQAKATLHRQLRDISKEIETLKLAGNGENSVVVIVDDEDLDDAAS